MSKPGRREFNYCLWAKGLVAIPALPLVAILAAWQFTAAAAQIAAAAVAVAAVICAAIWIDRLPCFLGKIVRRKP